MTAPDSPSYAPRPSTSTADFDVSKIGKRNRPPKSCEPCRIRKLKCNRNQPCDSCIKRGKEAVCDYAPNADRSRSDHGPRTVRPSDRLQRLEDLVLQFMENSVSQQSPTSSNGTGRGSSATSGPGSDSSREHPARRETNFNDTSGLLAVNGGETNYVDSNHWMSVLNEIKEVREFLKPSNIARDAPESGPGAESNMDIVFDQFQPLQLTDILKSVPPRNICDSLLSTYFNTRYLVLPIIHPKKFQREYEMFWKDQAKAPIMWVGLLFAILTLAASLRQTANALTELGGPEGAIRVFQLRTSQCLVLGKYAIPKSYAAETLILYLQGSFVASEDSSINRWVLMGVAVRLTMKMGMHRDPRHYPKLSKFDGEMRRRIWQTLFQLDILVSFQMGLPSMVQIRECDVEPPRNLHFSDFDENSLELPPSRPLTESTATTYLIVKGGCMAVFKKITTQTSSLQPVPYEEVLELDKEMRDVFDNIPPDLKMKAMSHSFTDAPSTIMNRINIKLLYLKSICVLHRAYLNQDRMNSKYTFSRRTCVEAALGILELQADIHNSALPGGQLYEDRWMLSSLTAHDFLLAAMVVSLDLSESLRVTTPEQLSISPLSIADQHTSKMEAVERSQKIWAQSVDRSKDARTAAEALALMLRKIKIELNNPPASGAPKENMPPVPPAVPAPNGDHLAYNMTQMGSFDTDLPFAEPMAQWIDVPENIDWAQLDQYFLNPDMFEPIDPYAEVTDFTFPYE